MIDLDETEDDAGYSDACEYEWCWEQAALELANDPFYSAWLELIEVQSHEIH